MSSQPGSSLMPLEEVMGLGSLCQTGQCSLLRALWPAPERSPVQFCPQHCGINLGLSRGLQVLQEKPLWARAGGVLTPLGRVSQWTHSSLEMLLPWGA